MNALEDLCRTIPDPDVAATGLDALFESNPSAAAAIAEERLARSLEASCVPGSLVALMARRGDDPFLAVAKSLDGAGCDRRRFRPDGPASLGRGKEDAGVMTAAKAAEEKITGECRRAFTTLFGLDLPDPGSVSTDLVE
jgi:hypothetical protein